MRDAIRGFEAAAMNLVVTALYRYPVKSFRGTAVESLEVGRRGAAGDRAYMVVTAHTGRFLTQREYPGMALIGTILTEDGLRLNAEGMPDLDVPRRADGERRRVTIWGDACQAVDQGQRVAEWLEAFLGVPCRLVKMADEHVRPVKKAYARDPGEQVAFTDGYPFLVISDESLADLNARLVEQLPMNRFRPNLVVGGGAPFEEDRWTRVKIGSVVLRRAKPCVRCVITTTDQETGWKGVEPLRTLATYRWTPQGVTFGQNMVHESTGAIRVGDAIEVLA